MTTETKKKTKAIVRIIRIDAEGKSHFVTLGYPHKTGGGHNFKIGDTWYSAFPMKGNSEISTEEEGA